MPRATISTEAVHHDLKTLPEGYVELRRMPYGKWLHRQEMAMKMSIEGGQDRRSMKGELAMANRAVTTFEFKECIVDHNLTDDADNPLDFSQPFSLEILDPKVGNEIGQLIMDLHEFDSGNSSNGSAST